MGYLTRRTEPYVDDKRISLGAFSGFLAILAPFMGYLLAYGWRSGEAQFYGIKQDLVGVSVEDGLRFALPLALILVCMVVVTSVDLDKRKETGEVSKKRKAVFLIGLVGFLVAAVVSVVFSNSGQGFLSSMTLAIGMVFVVALFASLLPSVLSQKSSIIAFIVIAASYFAEIFVNVPTVIAIVVAVLAFTLLFYLGFEGMLSAKRATTPIKNNLVMPYFVLGVAILGAAFMVAAITGFNAAGYQQHVVLGSGEVVLTTYNGDRSIVGTVNEQGGIEAYRVVNLSDEPQTWTVEKLVLKAKPLF